MLRNVAISLLIIVAIVSIAGAADLNEDLLTAANKGDVESVEALLAKGADANAKNSYGASALFFAADKGHLAVVKLLLEKKADVNARDTFYKLSPLDFALSRGRKEIAKALIDAGANLSDD